MDGHDDELDYILRRRAAPPRHAPGWERRVAVAAFAGRSARRAKAKGIWAVLRDELGGLVMLPRPAYALAAFLAIGIIAGLAAEPVLAMMQLEPGIFLEMEDDAI